MFVVVCVRMSYSTLLCVVVCCTELVLAVLLILKIMVLALEPLELCIVAL